MNKSVIITLAFALQCAAFGLYPAEMSARPGLPNQSVNQASGITGTVTDENGEPLIGVTVKVKGTKIATVTDFDGRFTLKSAGGGKEIVVTYVGYSDMTVSIGNGRDIRIQMQPDDKVMDEVVVIGYGTVKRRDLTGAISSVKAEDIKESPVLNAMEGLSGKIAGLDITRESGQAGEAPKILLRGNRSLNADCSPLYVIDGVSGGDITNINPNDIASIEVLKDAS